MNHEAELTHPLKKCHTTRPLPRGILTPAKLQPLRFGAAASNEDLFFQWSRGSCFFVGVVGTAVADQSLTKPLRRLLSYGFGSDSRLLCGRLGGRRNA